jgi:putative salt-induced outer membrane protein YdiY
MRRILSVIVCLLLAASPGFVPAAQVTLVNGDRLTGDVVTMTDGVLVLKTAYAGEVKIHWTDVQGLVSDTAVSVMLQDRTQVSGRISSPASGQLQVESAEIGTSAPIALAGIRYLNPSPQVLGLSPEISGRANLGFSMAQGNTKTQKVHADAETVIRYRQSRYTLGAVFNQAADDGSQTEYNVLGYGKYDYFIGKKTYLYANALFNKDKYQDLALRTTLGVGAGYQFWDTPERSLSLEAGFSYINDDFYLGQDSSYPSARWSVDYKQMLFGSPVQFFHFHEGYISLEDAADFLFRSNTGLRIPLSKNLAATAQFDADFDNTPAPGAKRLDRRYLLNLGYRW